VLPDPLGRKAASIQSLSSDRTFGTSACRPSRRSRLSRLEWPTRNIGLLISRDTAIVLQPLEHRLAILRMGLIIEGRVGDEDHLAEEESLAPVNCRRKNVISPVALYWFQVWPLLAPAVARNYSHTRALPLVSPLRYREP
jgi:hypothetical protein